jgi:hypothetical protein
MSLLGIFIECRGTPAVRPQSDVTLQVTIGLR